MGDVVNMPTAKAKNIPDLLEYLKGIEGVSNIRSYSNDELTDEKLMSESPAVRRLMIKAKNLK
jgi:hypothetical protein